LCDIDVMGQIGFTPTATRQWLKLSPQVRERIGKKLDAFAATGHGDVKKIKGPSRRAASGGRLARDFLRGKRNDRGGGSWSPARNL
jgi:mRNA-degrading endonuclease RelE of RelBE toxin-antitoxin system